MFAVFRMTFTLLIYKLKKLYIYIFFKDGVKVLLLEAILISVLGTKHLEMGSLLISFQTKAKALVVLDSSLTMRDHISSAYRSAYLEHHTGSSVHPLITEAQATAELTNSYLLECILSRTGYSTAMPSGLPSLGLVTVLQCPPGCHL